MASKRYLHCIYADDVRQEINNKLMIVGMYQGGMQVMEIPSQLPHLFVVALLHSPVEEKISSLKLTLTWDGKELITTIPPSAIIEQTYESQEPDSTGVIFQLVLAITPFLIDKEARLRVFATINESEEVFGNSLKISLTSPSLIQTTVGAD